MAVTEYIIACSILCYAAHWCLPWNRRRPLRKSTAITKQPLNDHLMSCAIWRWRFRKLHISEHILCNSCAFLTRNRTLGACGENFVAPYTQAKEGTNLTNKFEGRRLVTFFFILFFFCSLISVSVCDFFCGREMLSGVNTLLAISNTSHIFLQL